jgi:hypothetical protein
MGQALKTSDIQSFLNRAGAHPELLVDGISGPITQTALSAFLERLPALPEADFGPTMLQDDFEGLDSPPDYPGGSSGVTIGGGYDLAYETTFDEDWGTKLSSEVVTRLSAVIGIRGGEAQAAASHLKDIHIPREAAAEVLDNHTLPKYQKLTLSIYPELLSLLPDAQVALISLVYDRGSSLAGYGRAQMRAIQGCVAQADYVGIQNNLRAMIPLWSGSSIANDMRTRRNAEADLVLCAYFRTRVVATPVVASAGGDNKGEDIPFSQALSS